MISFKESVLLNGIYYISQILQFSVHHWEVPKNILLFNILAIITFIKIKLMYNCKRNM